ncbi:hypothetical protein, partial [Mycoplasmopsis felifaucium]|uniref:hypothetical protein n=1 Tax=Mycoplasmopsis felifaucium TaxID=35768 RepID=UPI00056AEBC4
KNILPFYFDYINDDIYLKSEFYEFEIKNKKINILNSKINYYLDRIKSTINPVDIDTDLNKLNENNQKYLTYFYSDNFNFIMPETPQEWTIPQRKTFWMNPEEFETLKGKEGRISEYSSLKNKVITKEYIYAKAINYFRENNINNYAIKAIEITPVIYEFNKRVKPSEQILWNTLKNNPGNIQNYLSSFTNIEESQGKKLENTSITLEIGAHMSRVRVETPAEMYSTHITLKLFYATVIYSTYEENNKKISSFITLPAIDIFGITGNTLKTLELNNSSKLVLTGAFLNKYLELEDANSSEIIKIMKTTDPAKSCQLIINNIYI